MKLLNGEAAGVIGSSLVIADLHLGIEFELRRKGFHFASRHAREAERLNSLLSKAKCKRVVVVGDAKHDARGFEKQERKMMVEFVDALSCGELLVVKGNHDSMLGGVPGLTVEPAEGFILQKHGLAHGHAWPSDEVLACKELVTGHEHPLFEFSGEVGSWRVPCWLHCATEKKGQELLVMPAFGSLSGGSAVNNGKFLGPLFNKGYAAEKKAFSLDGDAFGKV